MTQMPLAEHDHMIEALASDRADQSFSVTVLPEAIPPVWLRRNVLQPCDGGRLRRAIYFATEVWPMSIPSLRSSP